MIKNFYYVVFMTCHLLCSAQADLGNLKTDFARYASAIKDSKFAQATDYMPSILFNYYNKEQLIKEMKQAMESPDTKIIVHGLDVNQTMPPVIVDGITYISFNFNQKFDIQYLNLFDATDDEQSRQSTIKFIEQMMKESIPEARIKYDGDKDAFSVDSSKRAVAMHSSEKGDSWKFLVIEPSLKSILYKIVPAQVLQKLNYEK